MVSIEDISGLINVMPERSKVFRMAAGEDAKIDRLNGRVVPSKYGPYRVKVKRDGTAILKSIDTTQRNNTQ